MPETDTGQPVLLGRDIQKNYPAISHYWVPKREHKKLLVGYRGHYGYPGKLGTSNIGGAFQLHGYTTLRESTGHRDHWRGGPNDQHYEGAFYADVPPWSMWQISAAEAAGGRAWAAEAYDKMKPTKPPFPGLNAIYELKDVPAMLRQRFLKDGLRSIGNYYLALKFGWEPLLRDVRNLVGAQRHLEKVLKQLLRDNGKPVRRRVNLTSTSTTPSVTVGNQYAALAPVLSTQYYAGQPWYRYIQYTKDRVWASARWRFWLPGGPRDIAWTRKMLARLYGLNPTPQVIYNMIPWSWLVDWFSNAGDMLSGLDAGVADKLAAEYMYIMREKTWHREYYALGGFRDRNGRTFQVSSSSTSIAFVKTRIRGGPFHPSLSEENLTLGQLQILGALGISRL